MASQDPFLSLRAMVLPLALCCLAACNLKGTGDPPPEGLIYYPTALTLSADGQFLFVANSNFDRRYSMGSVQAYDLDVVTDAVSEQCSGRKAGINCEVETANLVHSEVLIGSLARAISLSSDGSRLVLPTQADGSLTYVDVGVSGKNAGRLSCGGQRTCSKAYSRGLGDNELRDSLTSSELKRAQDNKETIRSLVVPPDPVAITSVPMKVLSGGDPAASEGDAVVLVHRNGKLSLFLDLNNKPTLVHVLSGLDRNLTAIDFDYQSGLFHLTSEAYASAGPKYLQRVGLAVTESIHRSYLFAGGSTTLHGVSSGQDTWALAFDVFPDPEEVLVLARRPDSLLQVHMAPDGLSADVRNIIEVGGGAARMVTGQLDGPNGVRTIAVVSCITERRVFIVDVISGDVLSIIPSFSGPFVMAMDSTRSRAYVADFRSSTIRVIDLAPVLDRESARVIATLGHPRYLEELK